MYISSFDTPPNTKYVDSLIIVFKFIKIIVKPQEIVICTCQYHFIYHVGNLVEYKEKYCVKYNIFRFFNINLIS